ncbi:uncharacterized protein TNCV_3961161 [Trichonephila clavipes]|nr:uncharacterized protein TNCV_3961161 [Trichonephila clavipes]
MYIHTLQDALFIGYKQSLDNAIAFSQRTSSTHLIGRNFQNDSDIINNLIDYEDRQGEPDSLRVGTIYTGNQLSNKSEKHFLKTDTNSKKSFDHAYVVIVTFSSNCPTDRRHKNLSFNLWCQQINQLNLYLQVTKAILN